MKAHPLLGILYTLDGEELTENGQFEALIAPLGDYEAGRLLRNSEVEAGNAEIFHWAGIAAIAAGAIGILRSPSDQQTPFWGVELGGALSFGLGNILLGDSKADRFNCVQRYNRFALGEEQVLPKPLEGEEGLLEMDRSKAMGTPSPSK